MAVAASPHPFWWQSADPASWFTPFGVSPDGQAAGRELSLAEAHLAAAKVQAQAIYSFVGVLALGGLVVLLAILYESHSWRQVDVL